MKAYLITTGTVIALILLARGWRVAVEGAQVARDPVFVPLTLVTAGLSVWAWVLPRRLAR
jgi:hypothetical protein